ncbi:response regulator transcription factor [Salinarimonas soli]|uniref:Response regulator transcription factor n=1 Tax=Salinarimonas soli TaxID=1638099 RepID=A0A5B2VT51_9HYPH|nr:response regulator transcription factor [Salinarimonas soli]KAA2242185.1 response regulator transcription factor [Salinarimonas soli]
MRRERVLIVEGDRMKRELLSAYLGAAGYAVVEAASGEEGFSRLRMDRARIDRLVVGVIPHTMVCAAVLVDEFKAHHRAREALVIERTASPADVAALLQRAATAPAPVRPALAAQPVAAAA